MNAIEKKFDILCANFNNEKFLHNFFESIIASTILPECIVFVDDGSTDNSINIAESYKKVININIIKLEKNIGFANALNAGKFFCKSNFVARLDPDDFVANDRFEQQLNYLIEHAEVGLVGSQASYFKDFEKNNIVASTNMPKNSDKIYKSFLLPDNGVLHGTIMIRKNIFMEYDYVQSEVPAEDFGIFSRMAKNGILMHNLNDYLTFVRIHSNSVSNDLKFNAIHNMYKIRKSVFNIDYHDFFVWRMFFGLKYYRRALFASDMLRRIFFVTIASVAMPERVIARIIRFFVRLF